MSFWKKLFEVKESPSVATWDQLTSFLDAARDGDLEKVKALLTDNPDLVVRTNHFSVTPLHKAAFWGHKDVVELLRTYTQSTTPARRAKRSPP